MKKLIKLIITFTPMMYIQYALTMDNTSSPNHSLATLLVTTAPKNSQAPSNQSSPAIFAVSSLSCFMCKKKVLPQIEIPLCEKHTAHFHQQCYLVSLQSGTIPSTDKTIPCPLCPSPEKNNSKTEESS